MNIEEFSFDLDEKSVENFKKAINYDEIEARHKRFMNGTETIDDLINGILHYRIKNDDDLDLDVVEFKYYQKMIDLYEKEKEKNKKECHNCDEYTAKIGELETENQMLKSELEKEKKTSHFNQSQLDIANAKLIEEKEKNKILLQCLKDSQERCENEHLFLGNPDM